MLKEKFGDGYTTQNIIIESEQFGRVFFIASTSTDAGVYGLNDLTKLIGGISGSGR